MFHLSHTTPLPQGRDLAQSQKKRAATQHRSRRRLALAISRRCLTLAVAPPSHPHRRTRGRCHRRLALALAASVAAAPSLFNYPGPDWAQQSATAGLPSAKRRHRPALTLVRCPWWPALGLAQCRRRPALVLARRRGCRPALACARRGENDDPPSFPPPPPDVSAPADSSNREHPLVTAHRPRPPPTRRATQG